PESHAASFALLVYASCWLKCHEPAAFACALVNSQPMGFYAPSQIIADARRHGVTVLPVDVLHSDWDCTLDPEVAEQTGLPQPAIRLGLRLVRGISEDCARRIVAAREARPFRDVADLVARARLDRFERERLAEAGALRSLAGHRHRAFWAVAACDGSPADSGTPIPARAAPAGAGDTLPHPPLPRGSSEGRNAPRHAVPAPAAPTLASDAPGDLLQDAPITEQRVTLRPPSAADDVFADYATTGLTLDRHPVALVRRQLAARRIRRSDELATLAHGTRIRCAGLVTLR